MAKINRNQAGSGKDRRKLRILVAPLDWGLGHATRCIPVIYELLKQDAEVLLAGEGAQEKLLRGEFPGLAFLPLKGYRVNYSRSSAGFLKTILFQTPRILKAIRTEHEWLKKIADEYELNGIISDNRYGLYHAHLPCIFITHQLRIKSPIGKWSENILQKRNYRYISRFSECWIPDEAGPVNWAGELSHPTKIPSVPVRYTGILSRLVKTESAEKKAHLFISLSGPEPQRSILENKIVKEISHYNGTATVLRGLPQAGSLIPSTNDIHFYNHLPSSDFNKEMEKAEFVISRSGYSTVMDIVRMGKKAILIPTPGQTEQEYVGKYLQSIGFALTIDQSEFSLENALDQARKFVYRQPSIPEEDNLVQIISSFLRSL